MTPSSSSSSRLSLSLTSLDRLVLVLLAEHRVLTTTQLVVATDAPLRTLHHRMSRLKGAGLVSALRPYAAKGSAPLHHFLTAKGAALVGDPAPRRPAKTPTAPFLAHTAAVADVWLALSRSGPEAGMVLRSWAREEAAWEEWDRVGHRLRRVAPDAAASVEVDGAVVDLLIEVDRATMTTKRLVHKAGRYFDYANARAWKAAHAHCPVLLLLTTSEARAGGFLARIATVRRKSEGWLRDPHNDERLVVAACGAVERPERAVTAPLWRTEPKERPRPLADLLADVAARQRANEHHGAARAAEEAERRRWDRLLHATMLAGRELAAFRAALPDARAADGLMALVEATTGYGDPDRQVEEAEPYERLFLALAAWWREGATRAPAPPEVVAYLAEQAYPLALAEQTAAVLAATAHAEAGDPRLRLAALALAAGRLVGERERRFLAERPHRCAEFDSNEGGCAASRYRSWRAGAARRRWKALPFLERRRTPVEDVAARLDAEHLVACGTCGHATRRKGVRLTDGDRRGQECDLCRGRYVAWGDRPALPTLPDVLAALAARVDRGMDG